MILVINLSTEEVVKSVRPDWLRRFFFWYDQDSEGRRMTRGLAITTAGELLVADAICSHADNFEKRMGRKIVSNRIFGRAQNHLTTSRALSANQVENAPDRFSELAKALIPTSRLGVPSARAYHAGQQFLAYRKFMEERAREIIDE